MTKWMYITSRVLAGTLAFFAITSFLTVFDKSALTFWGSYMVVLGALGILATLLVVILVIVFLVIYAIDG